MKYHLILVICIFLPVIAYCQRNCGTSVYTQGVLNNHRELTNRYGRSLGEDTVRRETPALSGVITIPIAFHIIYHTADQKISKDLINQQVAELNDDFAGRNALLDSIPIEYRNRIADCEIHFIVDTIFYVYTDTIKFKLRAAAYAQRYESIKFTTRGGHNAMPSTKYLNVWVGNITDGNRSQLLGYSTFPGGDNIYDGVVIFYKAFGPQNSMPQFNMGRTLTHEIGHWLNLRHIWGDQLCGDDGVDDTPQQEHPNANCPFCPCLSSCSSHVGDMFMNYMDYVDDKCMFMFTQGQKQRMRANFIEYGSRASFIYSLDENTIVMARTNRVDSNATTVKDIIGTQVKTIIKWDTIGGASGYKILAKKVEDDTWTEITTTSNNATLTGLQSSKLYEVKVKTISADGTISSESTPYLFTTIKSTSATSHKLKIK